jgi:hypothetical protein
MTWNHRVIRRECTGETWYEIHECFYDSKQDEIPTSWTVNAIAPVGETPEGLVLTLQRMMDAVKKPILAIEGDTLVVISKEPQPEGAY